MRVSIHRAAAWPWHVGQWRSRHELYEGFEYPQPAQTSRWPPSAAVRHAMAARSALAAALGSAWSRRYAGPKRRKMSAACGRASASPRFAAGPAFAVTGYGWSFESGLSVLRIWSVRTCAYRAVVTTELCPRSF